MSGALKLFSGAEVIKKLKRRGWKEVRQKGSHVMMIKEGYLYTLSIPLHKEIGLGLLKKILKQAQISNEEFNDL